MSDPDFTNIVIDKVKHFLNSVPEAVENPVSSEEDFAIIRCLRNKKLLGIDGITNRVLKQLPVSSNS